MIRSKLQGKKIKRITQIIKDELYFIECKQDEELIYEIDDRGEYILGWICKIDKKTGKEIFRISDKNIDSIDWE